VFAVDIAVVLTGIPVYLYWTRRRSGAPGPRGG